MADADYVCPHHPLIQVPYASEKANVRCALRTPMRLPVCSSTFAALNDSQKASYPLVPDPSLTPYLSSAELKKKRAFRKFSYRGIDLEQYATPSLPPRFIISYSLLSLDSSTSPPNNSAMLCTPAPGADSTAA